MQDKKIGIQLKKARMESELSQEEVAKKLGITWEMISRYENGRSSAHKHLARIAKIYNKPVSYFLNDPGQTYDIFDIKQLAQTLKEEGIGYNKTIKNVVKYINELSGKGIEVDIENSSGFYEVASSLTEKYPDLFAINLASIPTKDKLNYDDNSVGLFSPELIAKETDTVLSYDGITYTLGNYDANDLAATIAVLVKIEQNLR